MQDPRMKEIFKEPPMVANIGEKLIEAKLPPPHRKTKEISERYEKVQQKLPLLPQYLGTKNCQMLQD